MNKFIKFLTSAFGALAGISVFFPFANELTEIICVSSNFRIEATTLTSIGCTFTVLLVYARGASGNSGIRLAVFSILGAFASIWVSLTNQELCYTQYSMLTYVGTFVLTTLAFSSLGALIFFRENPELVRQEQQHREMIETTKSRHNDSIEIDYAIVGDSIIQFIEFLFYCVVYIGFPILVWAVFVKGDPTAANELIFELQEDEEAKIVIIFFLIISVGYVFSVISEAWKQTYEYDYYARILMLLIVVDIGLFLSLFVI